jgi:DNA-binding NtrC family response regulator
MSELVVGARRVSETTVLVVDDEPTLARAAARLLRSMGFQVQIAAGGREAVEICLAHGDEIDVVLLDVVLREMSSAETLRQMRSLRPGIKAILTSGYGKQESMVGFAGIRLDGFVPKPFGYTELENAIRAALGTRAAERD